MDALFEERRGTMTLPDVASCFGEGMTSACKWGDKERNDLVRHILESPGMPPFPPPSAVSLTSSSSRVQLCHANLSSALLQQ